MLLRNQFDLTDILALATMFGGTTWLCFYTFRIAEKLRMQSLKGARGGN
jgi:hypothetical protein